MLTLANESTGEGHAELPEPVWERILRHPVRLLMLDFDGTIAPLSLDREKVRVLPDAVAAIARILQDRSARVAVVSGRPIEELLELLGGLPVHYVGEHGWEERSPNGLTLTHSPGRWVTARLKLAASMARASGLGGRLEQKRTAVVLHLREVIEPEIQEPAARVAWGWNLLRAGGGLRLDRGDGGFELRAKQRGKDSAAIGLLRSGPPGAFPVFVGDDASDEDAFRVVGPMGVTIRVGDVTRPTLAEWRLVSPDDVARFLGQWAERCRRSR